jgi:hypothetical protein
VCNEDEESSGCAHLYQTIGAEGKVVRLPESASHAPLVLELMLKLEIVRKERVCSHFQSLGP